MWTKILSTLGKFKVSAQAADQGVHFLLAFTAMTQIPAPLWLIAVGILGVSAFLELWFDPKYEGESFWPLGALDMLFYGLGTAAGWLRMIL